MSADSSPVGTVRVLLVSADAIAPKPTGSGNRAIRWGLINGLQRCGAAVGFHVGHSGHAEEFAIARAALAPTGVELWLGQPGPQVSPRSTQALAESLRAFRPDVVMAYGLEALRLVRATGFNGLVGVMSIDLEHVGGLHRYVYNLRFGRTKQQIKSFLQTPLVLWLAARYWWEVRRDYPTADFIVNHAANHARWHRRHHRRPTCYTPNPVAAVGNETFSAVLKAAPPRFILVGGIGGIATLTGLAWFATKVYPRIEPAIVAGKLEVHLIGRGELEPSLKNRMPRVVRRGYVEDLTEEMRLATAVLVPTPIELGFRTRILDAFRHGVTVIAHRANASGMPELAHDQNALVAADAECFAAAILQLAGSPEHADRLGRQALEDFANDLNAAVSARRILQFVNDLRAAMGVRP